MICAFFREVLSLIIEKVSLLGWSGAFDIFPVVSLLWYFHIVSIPVLALEKRPMVIVLEVILNRGYPSIVHDIIGKKGSIFRQHFIGRHISITIDPVKILILVIGLKELVHVGHYSSGRLCPLGHEPLVWDEFVDIVHVANIVYPEIVHLYFCL